MMTDADDNTAEVAAKLAALGLPADGSDVAAIAALVRANEDLARELTAP